MPAVVPNDFAKTYQSGRGQILFQRIVADLDTPVGTYLKLARDRTNTFLLESVQGGSVRGRFSMIGMEPDLLLRVVDGQASINYTPGNPDGYCDVDKAPLDFLRELVAQSQADVPEGLPSTAAGIYGYLGYDMVRHMEVLPDNNPDDMGFPDAILMRPSLLAVFDTLKDELYITAPVYPREGVTAQQAQAAAEDRIDAAIARLAQPLPYVDEVPDLADIVVESNTPREDYEKMILKAKDYIRAGDVFQVVLSQRFQAKFDLPPTALYRALRRTNPSPYMYFLDFGEFAIAGSSPEILVQVDKDKKVSIRPIAGTRKRGATKQRDEELAAELLADPKERAEHLMLLDLGRNDVGRVAKIGSVEVTDKYFLEYYSHVMHIVSNVVGDLDPKYDNIDALSGGFPAGTVSGAPKVRAMEIIDELEVSRRGIYGGCVGYFGADGTMDTCIVLRTAILADGNLYVQAGAGIVADSQPHLEQLECENKARALFSAAEEALRYADEAKVGQ